VLPDDRQVESGRGDLKQAASFDRGRWTGVTSAQHAGLISGVPDKRSKAFVPNVLRHATLEHGMAQEY
jgi:hypothetical protein